MNFNWYGNETSSAGTAEFRLRGCPIVKVQLDCFTDAVHLSNLMGMSQGYEPHEIPADYTGPLFIEGQMNAAHAAGKLQAAQNIMDVWVEADGYQFAVWLREYVEELK